MSRHRTRLARTTVPSNFRQAVMNRVAGAVHGAGDDEARGFLGFLGLAQPLPEELGIQGLPIQGAAPLLQLQGAGRVGGRPGSVRSG